MATNKSSKDLQLPPGFRFHPSDEELIVHYLKNKVTSTPLPALIIADIDLYKFNPWELPTKALYGEDGWYFFSPRDRKYPNGARPNRAAACGYWKATGTDKPILSSCGTKSVGVKKALVFYKGRPPKGQKTDWIMHEFRLLDSVAWTAPKRKGSMRLDDWVLCRVRQKSSVTPITWEDRNSPNNCETNPCFSKENDQWPTSTNNNNNIKINVQNCPMLPYIFASQDVSFNESSNSTTNFQNSSTTPLQFPGSSLDNFFDPSKRRLSEENQGESLVPPSKKIATRDTSTLEEGFLSMDNNSVNMADMCFFTTDHDSGDLDFSPENFSSLMQYPHLPQLDFTGGQLITYSSI